MVPQAICETVLPCRTVLAVAIMVGTELIDSVEFVPNRPLLLFPHA